MGSGDFAEGRMAGFLFIYLFIFGDDMIPLLTFVSSFKDVCLRFVCVKKMP